MRAAKHRGKKEYTLIIARTLWERGFEIKPLYILPIRGSGTQPLSIDLHLKNENMLSG